MIKCTEQAAPASYIAPSVDVVEIGTFSAILQVSGENEGYGEENWN